MYAFMSLMRALNVYQNGFTRKNTTRNSKDKKGGAKEPGVNRSVRYRKK